jgi:23S rRNA pseudouridine955/2504/2580 synthase
MVPILFDNDEILIIDKPFGLASQPGESVHDNVIAALARQTKQTLLPVHRLDKDTAGCMILAKDSRAARRCEELIGSKIVGKKYFAWVVGEPARH